MAIKKLLSLLPFLVLGLARKATIGVPHLLENRPMYVRMHYIRQCNDSSSDVTDFNINVTYIGTKFLVDAIGTLNRPVQRLEKAIFIFRRCNDPAEEQNCEYFQTWRFGREVCLMAEQQNMFWSNVMNAFTPRLKCPAQKGVYRVRNATVDVRDFQNVVRGIPLEKHFWRCRGEFHDHAMFGCLEWGASVLRGKN